MPPTSAAVRSDHDVGIHEEARDDGLVHHEISRLAAIGAEHEQHLFPNGIFGAGRPRAASVPRNRPCRRAWPRGHCVFRPGRAAPRGALAAAFASLLHKRPAASRNRGTEWRAPCSSPCTDKDSAVIAIPDWRASSILASKRAARASPCPSTILRCATCARAPLFLQDSTSSARAPSIRLSSSLRKWLITTPPRAPTGSPSATSSAMVACLPASYSSPVLAPNAPSSRALSTSRFIRASAAGLGSLPLPIPGASHRRVADERRDIHARLFGVDGREPAAEVRRGALPVLADDERGDALRERIFDVACGAAVGMGVDESRRDDGARRVDLSYCFYGGVDRPDERYAIAAHEHIGAASWRARAVDDLAVVDPERKDLVRAKRGREAGSPSPRARGPRLHHLCSGARGRSGDGRRHRRARGPASRLVAAGKGERDEQEGGQAASGLQCSSTTVQENRGHVEALDCCRGDR